MRQNVEGDGFDGIGELFPGVADNFRLLKVDGSLNRKLFGLNFELDYYLRQLNFRNEKLLSFMSLDVLQVDLGGGYLYLLYLLKKRQQVIHKILFDVQFYEFGRDLRRDLFLLVEHKAKVCAQHHGEVSLGLGLVVQLDRGQLQL